MGVYRSFGNARGVHKHPLASVEAKYVYFEEKRKLEFLTDIFSNY